MEASPAAADGIHSPAVVAQGGKYLTFRLGGGEFSIPVSRTREIVETREIVALPDAPAFCPGVIHLRGSVIPVFDLRLRLGLQARPSEMRSMILLAEAGDRGGGKVVGLLVDEVLEVVSLAGAEIDRTPVLAGAAQAHCLMGVAKAHGRIRLLLDIDAVLGGRELDELESSH